MKLPFRLAILIVPLLLQSANAQLVDAIRNLVRDPVVHAIEQGLKPGGDLAWEIQDLPLEYEVRSSAHAEVILRALKRMPMKPIPSRSAYDTAESALCALIQDVEADSEAFQILAKRGTPELLELYKALLRQHQDAEKKIDRTDELCWILRASSQFMSREAMRLVAKVAQEGAFDDYKYWDMIFHPYDEAHPYADELYGLLRGKVLKESIAFGLLEAVNNRGEAEEEFDHPFGSPAGVATLKRWLSDTDPRRDDFAVASAQTLAFTDQALRDVLLPVALEYPHSSVFLTAAAASASAGDDQGVRQLQKYCLDVDCSVQAMRLLTTLELADKIPDAAKETKFAALALVSFLKSDDEMGAPDYEYEILDQRVLPWLGSEEPQLLSLVRYEAELESPLYEADKGIAIVDPERSVGTYYFVTERLFYEEVYAIHCAWNAGAYWGRQSIGEVDEASRQKLLRQWTGPELTDLDLHIAYRLRNGKYPQDLVGCGSAFHDGQPGTAVFDGPRSRWYPQTELFDLPPVWVLQMHMGLVELGLEANPEGKPRVEKQSIEPELLVSEYEKLMEKALSLPEDEKVEWLRDSGVLERHFESYVNEKANLEGQDRAVVLKQSYEKLLEIALSTVEERRYALADDSVFGKHFIEYVDASESSSGKIERAMRLFEPVWYAWFDQPKFAYAELKLGLTEQAEKRLLALKEDGRAMNLSLAPTFLAKIYSARGETEKAKALLQDAINDCAIELKKEEDPHLQAAFRNSMNVHQETLKQL
ncbi:MAG: hypothetical protein AAF394_08620 [Planctomycetota bacterium]